MNAVIEIPHASLPATATDIKAHVQRIQEVMAAVMKEDVHYGTIPGTGKPTLYKAGSEVLLTTFRIAVEPKITDLSTDDEIRYRIEILGRHQLSGTVIGVGVGECSSNEAKYRWREAVCDDEFDETPVDRRRLKYGWKWGSERGVKITTRIKQVRTDHADLANTVLKMAKKRAQIDMTLTALAASDIFGQDLEDVDPELHDTVRDRERQQPVAEEPRAKGGSGKATEKQQNLLSVKASQAGLPEAEVLKHFEIASFAELPFDRVNEALDYIKKTADGG